MTVQRDESALQALRQRKLHRLPSGAEVVDLYGSVGGGYMLALDGRLFEWDLETDEREVSDPISVRKALVLGSRSIPELVRLIPSRPVDAPDCRTCEGTGSQGLSDALTFVCAACGGVGWID